MFNIEKGVPVPEGNAKYPFADMGVGDSFRVPCGEAYGHDVKALVKRMRGACTWAQRKHTGRKFIARADEDGKGVRVWRTL